LDPRNFHRRFKVQARKAGVPVVSVHSTRRTCASLLVELDVHPRVAMQILRHSRISITMTSIHRSPQRAPVRRSGDLAPHWRSRARPTAALCCCKCSNSDR
jgi:integrase